MDMNLIYSGVAIEDNDYHLASLLIFMKKLPKNNKYYTYLFDGLIL